jgi:uncharacterized delta-60 repeat protein
MVYVPAGSFTAPRVTAIAVQSDGKIVTAGGDGHDDPSAFVLMRFSDAGVLDAAFGQQGIASVQIPGATRYRGHALEILPDGRMLLAGLISSDAPGAGWNLVVVRLAANGLLDPTFGTLGFTGAAVGSSATSRVSMRRGAGGALYVSTDAVIQGSARAVVVRFEGEGQRDLGFATDGFALGALGSKASDLAVLADGRFLIATSHVGPSMAVTRFTAAGAIDAAFAGGTRLILFQRDGVAQPVQARALAPQPDGRVLLVGTRGPVEDFAIVRIDESGALDASYDALGVITVDFNGGAPTGWSRLVVRSDDSFLALGAFTHAANAGDSLVAAFTARGGIDEGFGGTGWIVPSYGPGKSYEPQDAAYLPDGRILLVGNYRSDQGGGSFAVVVARLLANGDLDTSFGTNGLRALDMGSPLLLPLRLAVLPNGTFVVAGLEGFGRHVRAGRKGRENRLRCGRRGNRTGRRRVLGQLLRPG